MATEPLIYRCPWCDRAHHATAKHIGRVRQCQGCQTRLRVPAQNGVARRCPHWHERLIELVVYGFGGAFLAALPALLLTRLLPSGSYFALVGGLAAAGFVIGGLGGERGVNWLGQQLRRE